MPDREKVIKLIEEEISVCESVNQCYRTIDLPALRDILAVIKEQQEYIEYWSDKYDEYGKAYMKVRDERDALLKKQEPMEPITDKWRNYVCPVCGNKLRGGKFCMNCGQAVKLE